MITKKNLIIGLIVVLVAGVTGHFTGTTKVIEQKLGAVSGPDMPFPYISVGGLAEYSSRISTTGASTTPCAIQSPASTSTLVFTALQITTASSTATTWTAATSTTAFATTSPIVPNFSLGSGAQGSFVAATSTSVANASGPTMAPNTWVVWGLAGIGNLTSDKLVGSCSAKFRVL